jgi:hypothetical protein
MIRLSDTFHQRLEDLLLIDRQYDPHKNIVGFGFGQKLRNGLPTGEEALRIYVKRKISPWNVPPAESIRPINRWIPRRDNLSIEDVYNLGLREQSGRPPEGDIWTDVIESPSELHFEYCRARHTTVMGGISIGIENETTTGTVGYIFRNAQGAVPPRESREFYILTAGHVLDNYGNASSTFVCQPGTSDCHFIGLSPSNCRVAEVVDIIGPKFSRTGNTRSKVDAGIAKPLQGDIKILELKVISCGAITEIGTAEEGMLVRKVGRTTGLTFGQITDVKGSFIVDNPNDSNESTIMSDQIITTKMSQGGDSGAVLIDERHKAIGLLCAGGDDKSVFTPMNAVINALGISLF